MTLKRKEVWVPIAVVVLVPLAAIGWWLGSPLFIDKTVEEEFPFARTATLPIGMSREKAEDTMATMAKIDSPMDESMAQGLAVAVAVKAGEFEDADGFHKGSGTATIYRLPDGTSVLRLESLRVTNGPDLHVIVTGNAPPSSRDDVHEEGYVDLGKLKGNIGNQNYPFPEGVDPADFNAVVIYCKPFHVIFSVAQVR